MSRRPQLRPVELLPVVLEGGDDAVLLRDPAALAEDPILLAPAGAALVARFDGRRTLAELHAALDGAVPLADLEALVDALDRAGYLEGPAHDARLARARADWEALPARPPALAGGAYAEAPEALRAELSAFYRHPDGPGAPPRAGPADPGLCGVFAPHIDPGRGGPVAAHAFRALVEAAPDAERFVVVGTGHAPSAGRVVLTAKDYDTPLGTLRTDRAAVHALAGRIGGNPFASELNHRGEHSVEFAAVYLAHALTEAFGPQRLAQVRLVPVLVGSFHDLVETGADPATDPEIAGLVSGLQSLLDEGPRRTVLVGSVDLAHLGTRFEGHPFPADGLPRLEKLDRTFLDAAVRGDAAAVFADVFADGDGRSYCGFPALWCLARAVGPGRGAVLKWGADLDDGSLVSFASGTLRRRT